MCVAERRMISSKIICSDAFIEMPHSTQSLYIQFIMEADDDGFLNRPKRVMRTIEATEADLNLLFEKRFILGFPNGVVVIKHWRIHNQIRKDRYTPTQYQDEFNSLEIKPDSAYTEKDGANMVDSLATTWQPLGNHLATKVRLGKDSIGKDSKEIVENYDSSESEAPIMVDSKSFLQVDYQQIVDMYNSICTSFPSIRSLSDARKKAIKARLNTYTVEDFRTVFENAEASSFLKGSNDRNWTATFDWLIKDSNMAKVLEGNYADKGSRYTRTEKKPGWMMQPSLELGKAELDAIQRVLNESDPDVQQEAEEMQRRMQEKYGRKVATL